MPSPGEPEHLAVTGVCGGVVHLRGGPPEQSWRWRPGTDPEPLPHAVRAVDAYTGTLFVDRGAEGCVLLRPDGAERDVTAARQARLAPGAAHLYTWTYEPPALTLFPVDAPGEPITVALPGGSETGSAAPRGAAWEDPSHMLVPARHARDDLGVPLVRVDVRTGAVEAVPLPDEATYRPLFVTPLP